MYYSVSAIEYTQQKERAIGIYSDMNESQGQNINNEAN